MSKELALQTEVERFSRQERERVHYNKLAENAIDQSLIMSQGNIRRYDQPLEDTIFPLEYAFHLLGDVRGKTVVDLGCGDGLNTVVLAALGAHVLAVDISDKSLEITGKRASVNGVSASVTLLHSDAAAIPVSDALADRVLCAAILHHVDPIATARQIRRVLKPGGFAVFEEPVAGPVVLRIVKNLLPDNEHVTDDERPLTLNEVNAVSRAVGVIGRRREFWLTTRLISRFESETFSGIAKVSQHFDAALLRRFRFVRQFASPLVWEALKER